MPFTLGDVTVLLQAHVIETAPYKILLGRPFDTITESTIINDQEENQTISTTCPNMGMRAAILTYRPINLEDQRPWHIFNKPRGICGDDQTRGTLYN